MFIFSSSSSTLSFSFYRSYHHYCLKLIYWDVYNRPASQYQGMSSIHADPDEKSMFWINYLRCNFMCQCNWTTGNQRVAKTFLNVSVRVLLEEISISIGNLKKITLTKVDEHHPIYWGSEESKKVTERQIYSFFDLRHLSSPAFRYWHLCSWAYGLRLSYTTNCHSSSKIADHEAPKSCKSIINKYIY